jgi:hypothetical protein
MSTDLAVKLGFALGSISANCKSRTLIAEFTRSATVEQDAGPSARVGVAARLVVVATEVDAKAAVSIPVLAEEGSTGRSKVSMA